MEKDQQAAVLALPQPGAAQPNGEVRLLPVSAVKIPSAAPPVMSVSRRLQITPMD